MTARLPRATLALLILCLTATPFIADERIPPPKGDVLLTVTGDLSVTNDGDQTLFDMAAFEALPSTGFTTTTNWTDGPQVFAGVSLKTLLDTLGVTSGTLTATAINDYAVEIPVSDAVEDGPIVAYRRNGEPMSVRDKGPLWIVYPYDSNPAYQSEVIYARSIWQLNRLDASE